MGGAGAERTGVLRALTRAESGPVVFAMALGIVYGLLPLAVHLFVLENEYFASLARVTGLGVVSIVVGSRLPVLDWIGERPRRSVPLDTFLVLIWGAFLAFVALAVVTAQEVPFLAALKGTEPETVAVLRERFLKAREGWQAVFPYVNAMLAGALVPYALVVALVRGHRLRWLLFGVFLVYCLSFVEKAFFLKAAIPLAYVVIQRRIATAIRPGVVLAGALALLVLVTAVSGVGDRSDGDGDGDFFTTTFSPASPAGFLFWRSVAVPVFTAADALRVFEVEYGGAPLLGASSSLLAAVLGRERVNVEREIFAVQWGQNETETGNANSVYLTEAFLNFGSIGVVVFSVVVGLILRLFARSRDDALRSLWMLFCFTIFVAPLTGTLFSNGFLPVIALSLFVNVEERAEEEELQPGDGSVG